MTVVRPSRIGVGLIVIALLLGGCAGDEATRPQPTVTLSASPVRRSTITSGGCEFTMQLPEDELYPGSYPVVLTLANRSSEPTVTGPLAFHVELRGADGRLIPPRKQTYLTAIGMIVDPGESYTQTRTVEFPAPGSYKVVGTLRLQAGRDAEEHPMFTALRQTLRADVETPTP